MAGSEINQPNLCHQDLSELDVTKLSPLSPEVISRQATINIGTIGHVAHGKSTVVKAISGVQTVRFKNELERNITIKLGADEALPEAATPEQGGGTAGRRPRSGAQRRRVAGGHPAPGPGPGPKKKRRGKEEAGAAPQYEVERIVDHTVVDGKVHFYVKWKGWDHKDNTWEPEEHLDGCEARLLWYFRCLRGAKSLLRLGDADHGRLVDQFKREHLRPTRQCLEQLMKEFWGKNGILKLDVPPESDTHKNVLAMLRIPQEQRPRVLVDLVRRQLLLHELVAQRARQREALDAWEYEMNTITDKEAPIKVENEVDLEGPPEEFTYITDYLPGEGISIPEDPLIGCSCSRCERRTKTCCGHLSNSVFAYTQDRRLAVPLGTPIYECNRRCRCKASCSNRVVQNGRRESLAIFRTRNGCGWGVKALHPIKTGTFVCEYVGEVISNEEAERRGKVYDVEGRTYLFDLDYNDTEQVPYTVDAASYGNVSHFINHSCSPNLAVFAVWIDCLDPNLPKLALFAMRHIREGEEITFDYSRPKMDAATGQEPETTASYSSCRSPQRPRLLPAGVCGEQGALPEGTQTSNYRMQCRCQAPNCRKYLF